MPRQQRVHVASAENIAALSISAFGVMWALLASFFVAPNFVKMFADFGTELPLLTRLFIGPWTPLALATAAFVVVVRTMQGSAKWVPIVVASVTTLLQPAIFLLAMYLPIFSLAGSLK